MDEQRSYPGGEDERIGAYRILQLLGRGGMGEVFLAWDDRLARRVAIKRIRSGSDLHPSLRQRLLREARAAAGLSHPAIVQVYDLIEDAAGGDCIVLEHIEGRTLAQILAGGPLSIAQALRLGREIAEGLAAAHASGIVHRDLKTENVIVTPLGHAKILDFGLAKPLAAEAGDPALTAAGLVVGTYRAMSPEQVKGGEVDERSDLFSLGVLCYEMLTGQAPFRGSSPLTILSQVLAETPPRVESVRPEIPHRLGDLIERLLAKAPDARPASAAEVARALAAIEASSPLPGSSSQETLSELPTGLLPPAEPLPVQAVPRALRTPPSTVGMSVLRRRRGMQITAAALSVAAVVGVTVWLLGRHPAKPLRVAVLRPEIAAKRSDERLDLAASGVLMALLGGLTSLQGLAPLDPPPPAARPASPATLARQLAADEVLVPTVEPEGEMARISLRRVQAGDGQVLWTASFKIPTDDAGLRLLADVIGMQLRRAYPEHELRPGTPRMEVRDEDYASFLAVQHRLDVGRTSLEAELPEIERILRFSPRFLEAGILAAHCHLSLFGSTRDAGHLERARALVRQARELAPDDPRPVRAELETALAAGRNDAAEEALGRLTRLLPGDPDLLVLRAEVAESRGRIEEALSASRAAIKLAPSWRNLYRLARLAAQNGQVAEARDVYQRILQISPNNSWALTDLGRMELLYGDAARAETIFAGLAAASPQQRYYFTNLGLARFLLGRYEGAVAAYQRALAIDPGHVIVLMNLADAQQALGRAKEATAVYQRVLRQLTEREAAAAAPLQPGESLLMAECLARLGRAREAAEITQRILRQSADDTEILYTASRIYALIGDRTSALINAQAARDKGMIPGWFTVPAFAPLQGDPEFRALLDRPATAPH